MRGASLGERVCLAALLLLLAGLPGSARGHGGGHGGGFHGGGFHRGGFHGGGFHGHGFRGPVVFGPGFWWGSAYPRSWYYPPPYYGYDYAPPVIVQPPPEYVEPPPQSYWYYCQSAGAYYPDVQNCPEPWVAVPTGAE
ncbi:MAG TPA: hypothetical protein VKM54_28480 [Myxococcota bacterium]|nr:hypothetical protein [Myxococcota bacterium]